MQEWLDVKLKVGLKMGLVPRPNLIPISYTLYRLGLGTIMIPTFREPTIIPMHAKLLYCTFMHKVTRYRSETLQTKT